MAIVVFAAMAFSALPLLLTSLGVTAKTRVQTQAKNLSALRIEAMRNLPFQVDRQNGPYVDLLDLYFTHGNAAAAAVTGNDGCSRVYLASAPGTGGAPSGAAFRTTCPTIADAPGFSQTIYTQFLRTTRTVAAVPTTYTSQAAGADRPPSQLLAVTVLTDYDRNGQQGRLRTYTEIADERGDVALVTTQARATALKVTSTRPDGQLIATAGVVQGDGSVTSGSTAHIQATAASLEQLGVEAVTGASTAVAAPGTGSTPNPMGSTGSTGVTAIKPTALDATTVSDYGSCGWGWFSRSAYSNVSATTADGVPVAPSNAASDVFTTATTEVARGAVLRNGSSCAGYAFGFRNWFDTPGFAAGLGLSDLKPMVYVSDVTGGDQTADGVLRGSGSVSGTSLMTSSRSTSARAGAVTLPVHVLPTASYGSGLVRVALQASSITCKSGGVARATFTLVVTHPAGTTTLTYDSSTMTTAPTLPDAASITFTEAGALRDLSQYLSWQVTPGLQEGDNGVRSLGTIFGLSVKDSVVGNGGFELELGSLSCVADDNR